MINETLEKIQNRIISLTDDPLLKMLSENSQLSKIQLETFLINVLTEEIGEKEIRFEQKARFRQINKKISRGAFNRTLRQAERNITKSINTILLLGYLGILDSPRLQPFIELSNKLNLYVKTYSKLWEKQKKELIEENKIEEVLLLKKELENNLKELMLR